MECPKCGNKQDDEVRCAACGIYFEKFRRQHNEATKPTARGNPAPASPVKVALTTAAVIGLGILLYVNLSSHKKESAPMVEQPRAEVVRPIENAKKSNGPTEP